VRFQWSSRNSETAVITMTVARIRCRGMSIEEALRSTLHNGEHCQHPELISDGTLQRLRKAVADKLQKMGGTRREGKRPAG